MVTAWVLDEESLMVGAEKLRIGKILLKSGGSKIVYSICVLLLQHFSRVRFCATP